MTLLLLLSSSYMQKPEEVDCELSRKTKCPGLHAVLTDSAACGVCSTGPVCCPTEQGYRKQSAISCAVKVVV